MGAYLDEPDPRDAVGEPDDPHEGFDPKAEAEFFKFKRPAYWPRIMVNDDPWPAARQREIEQQQKQKESTT